MASTFKLDPAAPSTFGATQLLGGQSFSFERSGDVATLSSDGSPFIKNIFIDNLTYTITVNMSDNEHSIKVGDTGILVLKAKERKSGEETTSDVLVFTFGLAGGTAPNETTCVVTNVSHTVNHSGNSETSVQFQACSSDGDVDPCVIS
jgi:hypothetical protein